MFKDVPAWQIFIIAALLMATAGAYGFAFGIDYQKQNGPAGRECIGNTHRETTRSEHAATCINGFWFEDFPLP